MDRQSKIILISGPTASGKSNFAIKIAKRIDGEIIKWFIRSFEPRPEASGRGSFIQK